MLLVLAAVMIAVSCIGQASLGNLGQQIVPFLCWNALAWAGYSLALYWLLQWTSQRRQTVPRRVLLGIVCLALLFRLILLFATPPTLSDDVYRYIWDGRLVNAGVNPYRYPVNSPLLDPLDSPLRQLVNHSWMATPYLPVAQAWFAVVYRLAPESPFAFQVASVLCDLVAAWLVLDLLRRLCQPRAWALLYLWNPLVLVEFAHGAHVDALMIFLIVAALWLHIAKRSRLLSVLALAAATLTKGVPALLLPLLGRRWGRRHMALYVALIVVACLPFALGAAPPAAGWFAGWGLSGPLDGTGVFGALRIYAQHWNYNSGLYHWLEVALTGYRTPGSVPVEVVGWPPVLAAKLCMGFALAVVLVRLWSAWQRDGERASILRWAVVPLGAYLLLTSTVHPWYVTMLLPFLPFLLSRPEDEGGMQRFVWPWLYLSAAVSLSYLTYVDRSQLREHDWVRLIEYVPTYILLIWASWPASAGAREPAAG
jgi:alpha-1,6-mannosyltransferase